MATPPVVSQRLTLNGAGHDGGRDDRASTARSSTARTPQPCYPLEASFPQIAKSVPFGPATLTVVGMDGSGAVQFEHTFDTFVGAGISNPTITFDVPPPDAGIDAPPDAPPDA